MNKKEYVDLMVKWKLMRGVAAQTESLVKGLREMIPFEYLKPFDPQELEWVIAGTPEINLEDWKANTVYWGGKYRTSTGLYYWDGIRLIQYTGSIETTGLYYWDGISVV